MNHKELLKKLAEGRVKNQFRQLYGNKPGAVDTQISRYASLMERFNAEFPGSEDVYLFSTPGRTEVGGNHTDHNAGRVLAAAVNLDLAAAVSPSDDDRIIIHSEGYPVIDIHVTDLGKKENERFTSAALVRGVCARLKQTGYQTGGFRASVDGQVPRGSGLSSSAAFEVMMVTILNHFYNNKAIDNTLLAQIAQYSENEYFGKPCGLMDQTTCTYGGLVFIDFKDFEQPVIEKISYDFSGEGYSVLIIDTGGNHADLNEDYIALENEMKSVAACLGGSVLREFSETQVLKHLPELRSRVSDRAILRALHFYSDDQRVVKQVQALKDSRLDLFLSLIRESGDSSWMLCQNCYSSRHPEHQGISIGLALSAMYLDKGAWRVHGGGFAGTIQVFIPDELLDDYVKRMNSVFGTDACHEIFIRSVGTTQINIV